MPANASAVSDPKPRVLIVDDHELVRAGIASLLRNRWDICGEAGDGAEAIDKVRHLKPDIVLLDLSMPVMSGTLAAKAIRTVAPNVKIVFVSMHDSPTVVDLVRMAGADGFVSKHCRAEEFRARIAEIAQLPST